MKSIYSLLPIVLLLSACNTTYKQAQQHVKNTQYEIANDKAAQKTPVVVIKPGYYVDQQPIGLSKKTSWLDRHVNLQANNLPFSLLNQRLFDAASIGVSYDSTVQPKRLMSIDYSGTVQGALQRLSDLSHYFYTIDNNTVNWSSFETQTFDISYMPGQSTYLVGQAQNEQQNNNNSNNNGSNGTQMANINHLNDMQYSNLQGQLSVWDDLDHTLNALKSKEGVISVEQATSSVTVHDHPDNVRAMAHYIQQLNHSLSKEVSIRVQVLEIKLNKGYNYGIDWNAVANIVSQNFNGKFKLAGDLGSGTDLVAMNLLTDNMASTRGTLSIGNGVNQTIIGALSQEGQLRVVTRPEVVTMNNQIASIRITQDTGYLQSVSSSVTENFVTTSITPGTVTDGFTLYVLPKIQDGNVYMEISSRIATLLALQKESTEPLNVESGKQSPTKNSQYSAIEVPTIAEKEFNQRSVVPSGSTLIIAGYKRLQDETTNAKYFGVSALGGQGAVTDNVETLILITPVVMNNSRTP